MNVKSILKVCPALIFMFYSPAEMMMMVLTPLKIRIYPEK